LFIRPKIRCYCKLDSKQQRKKIFSRKFRNFVRYRLASFCENQRNAYHDEQVAFNEIEYTGRHGCDELADLGRVI
ncbi:hypothetical protein T05_3159, partial [Trichinella murrelli]